MRDGLPNATFIALRDACFPDDRDTRAVFGPDIHVL